MKRVTVPALEEILGEPYPLLDDGFVRVVDYMGGDASIVQAARVSYGEGTRKVREDRALIRYLVRMRHTTPLEMANIKLHIRAPLDVWRQWIRHRTASVNEYSTRYSIAIDAAAKTSPDAWRTQAKGNRQGSDGYLSPEIGEELSLAEAALQQRAREVYEDRLREGVAREQARKDLTLSTYTEAYWRIDLHNLLHFLGLRMGHAQEEIRAYATVIGQEIVARWCPIAWEAIQDYHPRMGGMLLSRAEANTLGDILRGLAAPLLVGSADGPVSVEDWLAAVLQGRPDDVELGRREKEELTAKLRRIVGPRAPRPPMLAPVEGSEE